MKYPDLYALLTGEPQAKQYFYSLPEYVRDQIGTRPQGVHSFEDLQSYVENLLNGEI